MRRVMVGLAVGIALGALLTLGAIEAAGGRYRYFTMPDEQCRRIQMYTEVVPHQPNPCHFREPRWSFIR